MGYVIDTVQKSDSCFYDTRPVKGCLADLLRQSGVRTAFALSQYLQHPLKSRSQKARMIDGLAQQLSVQRMIAVLDQLLSVEDQQVLMQLRRPGAVLLVPRASRLPWQLRAPWPALADLSALERLLATGCVVLYKRQSTIFWAIPHEVEQALDVLYGPCGTSRRGRFPVVPSAESLIADAVTLLHVIQRESANPTIHQLHQALGGPRGSALMDRRTRVEALLTHMERLSLIQRRRGNLEVTTQALVWMRLAPDEQWQILMDAWQHNPWCHRRRDVAWAMWNNDWQPLWSVLQQLLRGCVGVTIDLDTACTRWAALLPLGELSDDLRVACVRSVLTEVLPLLGLATAQEHAVRLTAAGELWVAGCSVVRETLPTDLRQPLPDGMPATLRWAVLPWCIRTASGWRVTHESFNTAPGTPAMVRQALQAWYPLELPLPAAWEVDDGCEESPRTDTKLPRSAALEAWAVLGLRSLGQLLPWVQSDVTRASRQILGRLTAAHAATVDEAWAVVAPWLVPVQHDAMRVSYPAWLTPTASQNQRAIQAVLEQVAGQEIWVRIWYAVPSTRSLTVRRAQVWVVDEPYVRIVCEQAQDERTLRLDRILQVEVLDHMEGATPRLEAAKRGVQTASIER